MKFSDYKEDILKGVPVFFQLFLYLCCRTTCSMHHLGGFIIVFILFFLIRGML